MEAGSQRVRDAAVSPSVGQGVPNRPHQHQGEVAPPHERPPSGPVHPMLEALARVDRWMRTEAPPPVSVSPPARQEARAEGNAVAARLAAESRAAAPVLSIGHLQVDVVPPPSRTTAVQRPVAPRPPAPAASPLANYVPGTASFGWRQR
jgi:hypothetical protein